MSTGHDDGAFSDDQVALAALNYQEQLSLIAGLEHAFKISGMTISELAAELELGEEDASAWIGGDVDLTLSELRHLANAIDAHVSYRVGAIKTSWPRRFLVSNLTDEVADLCWVEPEQSEREDHWAKLQGAVA